MPTTIESGLKKSTLMFSFLFPLQSPSEPFSPFPLNSKRTYINIGAALLRIFRIDIFKSTTNSDTFDTTRVSLLVVLLNVSLRKMHKSAAPLANFRQSCL